MIEVYSENVNVAANSAIPFNSVALKKGDYESVNCTTLELNHCGVYKLNCHGSVTGAGDIVIQVSKDGVLLPQTKLAITGTADADIPFAFETLIQVSHNNGPRCCQSPTNIQIMNAGVAATFNLADVSITKVC